MPVKMFRLAGRAAATATAAVLAAAAPVLPVLMVAPAQAATGSSTASSQHQAATQVAKPHHHFLGAVPRAPLAAPAHTFQPVAGAPDAPQDPGHLGGGTCFSTAPGNPCTLRAAVMEANAEARYIAIVLAAGTYRLSIAPTGTSDASTGNLDVTDPATVSITGVGPAKTHIDATGMGDRAFRLAGTAVLRMAGVSVDHGSATPSSNGGGNGGGIDIADVGATAVFNNVAVTHSTATAGGGGLYVTGLMWATGLRVSNNSAVTGGGIYNINGSVQLVNPTLSNNTATVWGGGLFNDYVLAITGGTVSGNHVTSTNGNAAGGGLYITEATTLVGTTISNNSATTSAANSSAVGGGIFNDYGLNRADRLSVTGNSANGQQPNLACCTGDGGGGIYDKAGLTLTSSRVSGNKTDGLGGGLLNTGLVEQLTRDTFDGNSAGLDGGGIYGFDSTHMLQSTVSNNTAGRNGGGFYSDDGQQIDQSLFTGNKAVQGGAFFNSGNAQFTNDTFAANTAAGSGNAGGAIFNMAQSNSGLGQLTNVTIAGNVADVGAGLANGMHFALHNSILAGNHAAGGGDRNCDVTGGALTDAGNNIDSGTTCGLIGPGSLSTTNPKLGPLSNNGGPTPTMALLAGSPAINAGDAPAPSVDQRGMARDQHPDIGAYEKQ